MSTITESAIDAFMLHRCGYSLTDPAIALTRLHDMRTEYDVGCWATSDRTMGIAHLYISEHFDELPYGAVVDVEYILGETSAPCASKRKSLADIFRELR